jgi:hypothetical protein
MSNIAKLFEPQLPRPTNAIISRPCEKCRLAPQARILTAACKVYCLTGPKTATAFSNVGSD